jgi:serine/threonine protein kinase
MDIIGSVSESSPESTVNAGGVRDNISDALLVLAPYYNKPTQEGIYRHFRAVARESRLPIVVYNIPSRAGVNIAPATIARMAKDVLTRYSMTNTVVGTPPYMAPEQEQGMVRKESDVYSLSICAYEMLTGKLPFIGIAAGMLMNKINMSYIPPSRAIAGLAESFDDVFLKAFQADPDRRYRTPQEFVAAFAASADGARLLP